MTDDWITPQASSSGQDDWITSGGSSSQPPSPPSNSSGGFWKNVGAGLEELPGGMVSAVGNVLKLGDDSDTIAGPRPVGVKSDDTIPNAFGNSGKAITHAIGNITGLDPASVQQNNWVDQVGHVLGGMAPFLLAPEAEAPMAADELGTVGTQVIKRFANSTIASAARKVATGTGAAVGSVAGSEAVPDDDPILKNAFSVLGGIAGGFATAIPEEATALTKNIVNNATVSAPGAADRLSDFQAEGIQPLASYVSGDPHGKIASTEAMLSKTPGGSGVYQTVRNAAGDAVQSRINDLANKFGSPTTIEQAGTATRKGLAAASDKFKAKQSALYDDALAPVLTMPVDSNSMWKTQELATTLSSELSAAPSSLTPTIGPSLTKVNAVLNDVRAGTATIDALRQVRTNIGRDISDPLLAGVSGSQQPYLRRIYSALSDDINTAATTADPTGTVANNLAVADRYTRINSNRLNFLQDFIGSKLDGQIYNAALSSGKTGGQTLTALRKTLVPDQWNAVAGTVLGRMGRARPSAQVASGITSEGDAFSPATFMTNWSSLTPEAKTALFGGTRYQALAPQLDRLVRITQNMRDFDAIGAGSPTYERSARYALMSGMAGLATANVMSGRLLAAIGEPAAVFLGGYVAPKVAAKYMTNPEFVSKLANRMAVKTPGGRQFADRALRSAIASSMVNSSFNTTNGQSQ